MIKKLFLITSAIYSANAIAEGAHRELDAHEHGKSMLQIAIEDHKVVMELTSPGMDIVGFEHNPEKMEDRNAIQSAVLQLGLANTLFEFNDDANCALTEISAHRLGADNDGEEEHDHEDGHDDEDSHDHEEGHDDEEGHDHEEEHDDEEGHDHEEEHDDEEDHDHEEEHDDEEGHDHEEDTHSEFHAKYELYCENTAALNALSFPIFGIFENAKEIDVQLISDNGTVSEKITRENPKLSF